MDAGDSRRRSGGAEKGDPPRDGRLGETRLRAGSAASVDSGFSRGRLSGVSVCADRVRSRRVRCPDSLCHSWHTKNKSGDRARIYRGAVLRANITPCEFRS